MEWLVRHVAFVVVEEGGKRGVVGGRLLSRSLNGGNEKKKGGKKNKIDVDGMDKRRKIQKPVWGNRATWLGSRRKRFACPSVTTAQPN